MPLIYAIEVADADAGSASIVQVHYSRVIHLADETLESDVYGTPRLQPMYNRMQDLETIVGGSAEMFWRGAYPGLSFEADKDTNMTAQDMEDVTDEIKNYMHGMNRFLRLQGMKTNQLNPTIASPEAHVKVQLQMVSAVTQIPVRLLTGSERGELSSNQDADNWDDRVDERRQDYAEPQILRPFIDSNIEAGVLQNVEYTVKWPDITAKSDEDIMKINKDKMTMVKDYLQAGADMLMSPVKFLVEFLEWDEEEAKTITAEVEKVMEEEQTQIAEDEKMRLEAEQAFIKQTGGVPARDTNE